MTIKAGLAGLFRMRRGGRECARFALPERLEF
jgi:hypothetical protein